MSRWIPSEGQSNADTSSSSAIASTRRVYADRRASCDDEVGHFGCDGWSGEGELMNGTLVPPPLHQELHWQPAAFGVNTKYRSGPRRNAPSLEADVWACDNGVVWHFRQPIVSVQILFFCFFFPYPIWPIVKEGKGCENDITVLLCYCLSSFHLQSELKGGTL